MPELTDTSRMPYGKHKNKRMIDVPADYLIWLYDNKKCSGGVFDYVEDNIDVLNKQVKDKYK